MIDVLLRIVTTTSSSAIDSQPCRPLPPSSMIWAEAAPPSHPTKTKKKVNFSVSKPESINLPLAIELPWPCHPLELSVTSCLITVRPIIGPPLLCRDALVDLRHRSEVFISGMISAIAVVEHSFWWRTTTVRHVIKDLAAIEDRYCNNYSISCLIIGCCVLCCSCVPLQVCCRYWWLGVVIINIVVGEWFSCYARYWKRG